MMISFFSFRKRVYLCPRRKDGCALISVVIVIIAILAAMLLLALTKTREKSTCLAGATEAERYALDNLAAEIKGAVVYTRGGRVRKVVIGSWETMDLGEGEFVRWGPKGMKIAVYHKGVISVMNADGTNRKKLISVGGEARHCPIEFHTNGKEIIYVNPGEGLWTVRLTDGVKKNLGLSGNYDGEPGISADGKRLAARQGHNMYAIDLHTGQIRKYGRGCSSGVSPDGNWLMHNLNGHGEMIISSWNGEKQIKINSKTCLPDQKWDNHHWSNNNGYIAVQGSGKLREVYVFSISKNHGTRLTWEGSAVYPDLFVVNGGRAIRVAVTRKESRNPHRP